MQNPKRPLIYYISDMEEIIGKHRVTLRRWWEKGILPTPTLINNRLAWKAEIVNNWINNNVQGEYHV